MEKQYSVYIHISPSKKIYIGQTCDISRRWSSKGAQYASSKYFYNAIQKYGWDNFKHIIIKEKLNKEEADALEKELIKKYDSTNPNKGYNISGGGSGVCIITEELRKKKQEVMLSKWKNEDFKEKVRVNSNKKLVQCLNTQEVFYSCETAAKWCNTDGAGIRKCCENIRYHAGKHPTSNEELYWKYINSENEKLTKNQCINEIDIIKKREFNKRSVNNGANKQIKCINTGEFFFNVASAARWCNLSTSSNIVSVCKGRRKSAGRHPITGEKLMWTYC